MSLKEPALLPEHMGPEYNTIFQRLVQYEDDLEGLIAYGLYKQAKRDWIVRFFKRWERRPDAREMASYHDHFSEDELERMRAQARDMMLAFAEVIVADREQAIRQDALGVEMVRQHSEIMGKLTEQSAVWVNVKANIIAGLIMAGVTVVIVLGLYLTPDLRQIVESFIAWVKGSR